MTPERIAQLEQMLERGTICKGHIAEMLDAIKQHTWVDVPDEEIKILWIQYRAALPRYLCFAKALLARAKEENT